MSAKPKLAKKHIDRLARMIAAHEKREAMYQTLYGDVYPGTVRATSNANAVCLRATLKYLREIAA